MSFFGMLRAFQQLSALSSPAAVASVVNDTRMPTGGRIVNVNAVPGALKVSAHASSETTPAHYRRRMTSYVRWQSGGDSCVFVCHFVDNDCVHIVDPVSFSAARVRTDNTCAFARPLCSAADLLPSWLPLCGVFASSLLRLAMRPRWPTVSAAGCWRPGIRKASATLLFVLGVFTTSEKRKRSRCSGRHDVCNTLARLPIRSCITAGSLPIALYLAG